MEEKKKNKKIIAISIIIVVVLVAIIGTIAFLVINKEKLTFYNATLELGQENYIEELTKQENIYIKEGYTYSVKESKIDINNVGTYDVIFELKGKGKTIEEIKQVQVKDTIPPTLELKKDTFFVGDNINIEEIISIKDLSQAEEITYSEAKAELDGQFDTSKEGESTVNITVQDKSGNKTTEDITIKIKNPIINLYDYIESKCNIIVEGNMLSVQSGNDIKFWYYSKYNSTSVKTEGSTYIDFTNKVYKSDTIYQYSGLHQLDTVVSTNIYFDNELNIIEIQEDYGYGEGMKKLDLNSEEAENKKKMFYNNIEIIYTALEDNNKKIKLTGKTIEQIKNQTIDLRELQ